MKLNLFTDVYLLDQICIFESDKMAAPPKRVTFEWDSIPGPSHFNPHAYRLPQRRGCKYRFRYYCV